MDISWHIEKRLIKDLKDHPKNPRKLSREQQEHLKTSIQKFGLIDKPIINLDNKIIGGHQRKKTLAKLGLKEIDVNVPNRLLNENEVDELNIRLNKNTGDWDFDVLQNDWQLTDLLNWGFTVDEFPEIKEEINGKTDEDSEILEPKKDEDALTKLGDYYDLNDHRLVCGDSTLQEIALLSFAGYKPILMVTDPPYGVNYEPSWRKSIKKSITSIKASGKVQNDNQVDWTTTWKLFPGDIIYIWHAAYYSSLVQSNIENADFEIICQIIWQKQHFALSRGDYHWQHEPCWYAVKKGKKHNWQGSRKESTLWLINNLNAFGGDKDDERTAHSTQKPIECMAKPIKNNTEKGQHVYDPFLGSGTTLIAAEMLDRICHGIELSPAYCDIIIERWIKYMTKNNKTFILKKNGEIFEWPAKTSQ